MLEHDDNRTTYWLACDNEGCQCKSPEADSMFQALKLAFLHGWERQAQESGSDRRKGRTWSWHCPAHSETKVGAS